MKLQTRSILFFIPLFAINIIAVIFFVNINFQNTLEENTLNESRLLSNEVKIMEDQLKTKALSIATMVATNPDVMDAYTKGSNDEIRKFLRPAADLLVTNLKNSMDIEDLRFHFHIAPVQSLYRTWTDKKDDDLSSFRHSVKQVIQTGKPIMGIELGKGGMVIRGIHPIKIGTKTVGSVEMYFQPQQLLGMMNIDKNKIGLVLLADEESLLDIIFEDDLKNYYNKGEIGSQMISYISSDWIKPDEDISADLIEKSKKNSQTINVVKGNHSLSYIPINDFQNNTVGFYIFIQNMKDQIQHNKQIQTKLTILLIFANIIILLILIFWIFKFIIRPIKRLDKAVEIISRGSGDLTHRITVKRQDELGTIGENFNSFLKKLTEIVRNTKNASEGTEHSSRELTIVSDMTMKASHAISESIIRSKEQLSITSKEMDNSREYSGIIRNNLNDFQESIEQLSAIVEESSAGLTEMMASLENVNKLVQNRQSLTEELVVLSNEGEQSIGETTNQIDTIKDSVSQIEAFTSMIDDIASQTNLLSMNAAIEAAHAGDAGKGFAVVAEEIRGLAETSAEESKQISGSIKKITEIILNTEKSGKASKEAFMKISKAVKNVAEGLSGIALSTNEITSGSREVMNAILEVRDVTINVKDSSAAINQQQINLNNVVGESIKAMGKMQKMEEDMGEKSSEIESSMKNLVDVVEQLNTDSADMKEEIKRFELNDK
ncbi:MAG: hypothetical protein B6241_01970 [Spirochaetaceae bacterium 4572_59]|nr:MAG: hypothetical protein B6241_01970 [Spirochaetaceae bacterium 4572_59]